MKKLLGLLAIIGLFLAGCSEQSSVTGPSQQNSKLSNTFIKLGADNLSLQKDEPLYIEKTINGDDGGQVNIVGSFDKGKIQVNGTLTVPVGAFTGNQTITILMEGKYAVIDFGPSPFKFDKPLLFTMEITGVKIKEKDEENIHFIYLDDNGTAYPVEMKGTTVASKENKMLAVYGAELLHFSRYGWSK